MFNELKRRTHSDPGQIPLLWKESKRVQEIGNRLCTLTEVLESHLARSRKLVGPVPAGFPEAFKEYQQGYAEKVLHEKYSIDIDQILKQMEDAASPSATPTNQALNVPTEAQTEDDQEEPKERSPNIEVDEYGVSWTTIQGESEKRFLIEGFDPAYDDDAYEAFSRVIDYVRDRVESALKGGHDESTLINLLSRGLGAFEYFCDPIGLDLEGMARRWKQVPDIFVPQHVVDAHGLTERGSLYDLHRDADRAYVFGAPAAAMGMCRALCEDVLKRHYGLENKKNKRGYGLKLGQIIFLAEEKYEWIKQLKVGSKVENVNSLLHRYDRAKMMTTADEKLIVDFLTTAKTLIERAPLQHGSPGTGTRGNT